MTYENRVKNVEKLLAVHPDFPKPGIVFRDIFPLMRSPDVFSDCIDLLTEHIKSVGKVDVIVGLEARGFLFGPLIALKLGAAFVPIRKSGKLPGQTKQVAYSLEYGKDIFECQDDAITSGQRVVIVDDLLATGGTMKAACELVKLMSGQVLQCVVLIELCYLKGRDIVPDEIFSLISQSE